MPTMLEGINAIKTKPKFIPKPAVRQPLIADKPFGLTKVVNLLKRGTKTRKELLALPISKGAVEQALSYLNSNNLIEKIPHNKNNPRMGMSYRMK